MRFHSLSIRKTVTEYVVKCQLNSSRLYAFTHSSCIRSVHACAIRCYAV